MHLFSQLSRHSRQSDIILYIQCISLIVLVVTASHCGKPRKNPRRKWQFEHKDDGIRSFRNYHFASGDDCVRAILCSLLQFVFRMYRFSWQRVVNFCSFFSQIHYAFVLWGEVKPFQRNEM